MSALRAHAPLHALFARLLLYELDAVAIRLLSSPGIVDAFEQSAPGTRAWLSAAHTGKGATCSREEFARLFLLPGPQAAPPLASAWSAESTAGEPPFPAALTLRALEALGREPAVRAPWGRLPPDHAGLLFELTSHALARCDGLGDRVAEHLWQLGLAPWIGTFGAALATRAESPVYAGLGGLLAGLTGAAQNPSDICV